MIDELGFLMLNGAFAERLYPGVTTVMTRARYLIFVPAIYRYLEQSRKALHKDVDRIVRELQFELRNALEQTEDSFIGKESGRGLIRTPSSIYWSALGALGVATRRVSEATYQSQLSGGAFGLRVYKDEDDAVHDDDAESLWTQDLRLHGILPGGKFTEATSLKLRKSEAVFLETRYATLRPNGNENLVTQMVSLGRQHGASSLDGFALPWDIVGCSSAVNNILNHARRLSLLARGATLQYYRMLLEKKHEPFPAVESAFINWWEQAREDLKSWDVEGFAKLMANWGAGRGTKDYRFISGWLRHIYAARNGQDALADKSSQLLVSQREDYVRPGKQRLRVKHQLESWKLPAGLSGTLYQMDYRHRVGRQIARDIVEGMLGGQA